MALCGVAPYICTLTSESSHMNNSMTRKHIYACMKIGTLATRVLDCQEANKTHLQQSILCAHARTHVHAHTHTLTHTQAPLHPPTLPLKPKTQQCKQTITNMSIFGTIRRFLHAADHVRKSIAQHEHAVPSETARGQPETPVYFRLCHTARIPGSQHGSSSNLHPLCLASRVRL